MKPYIIILPILLTGCSSPVDALRKIPDGKTAYTKIEIVGRVTNTTAELVNGAKTSEGLITAESLKFFHSNPWIQKIDYEAKGVEIKLPPK